MTEHQNEKGGTPRKAPRQSPKSTSTSYKAKAAKSEAAHVNGKSHTLADKDSAVTLNGAMGLFVSTSFWPLIAIRKSDASIVAEDFADLPTQATDADMWCSARVAEGYDLYFPINPLKLPLGGKASKSDVLEARWLYVDCDPPADLTDMQLQDWRSDKFEELREGGKLGLKPTVILDSGRGYWGLWELRHSIPLDGPKGDNTRRVEAHGRALRGMFEGADACQNVDRICRLPGYRNSKTGGVAKIVYYNPTNFYRLEDFPREIRKSAEGETSLAYAQYLDDATAKDAFAKYLAKQPPAIEGKGGRDLTKNILNQGMDFGLRLTTAAQVMTRSDWNKKCVGRWGYIEGGTTEIEWELRDLENSRRDPIGCDHPVIVREKRKKESKTLAAKHLEVDERQKEKTPADNDAKSAPARTLSEVLNDPAASLDDTLHALNTLYAFALEGGKATVLRENIHPVSGHRFYERMAIQDFTAAYQNRKFSVPDGKGEFVTVKLGSQWLSWLYRRQYLGGVTFAPGRSDRADVLNLWRGFAVQPIKGSWRKTLRHIRNILCRRDRASFKYFIRWMAFAVQHPETRGHVALIMRGDEGVGKGIIANALRKIFGQHGLHIGDAGHLVGRFNDHLQCCVLLFADEAFFAGDRAHVAILKKIITEDTLEIEGKFRSVVESKNYLHLIMASNDAWVVPASLEARRFAVFDVSDERRGDHAYFQEIADELDNGGLAAMLHDLLKVDLSKFNIRNFPRTEGLQNQQLHSLSTQHEWLLDVLQRGYVCRSQHRLPELGEWRDDLSKDLWFESYARFAKERGERRPMNRVAFGKFMTVMGAVGGKSRSAIMGETHAPGRLIVNQKRLTPVYRYGDSLLDARQRFEEATGLKVEWEASDD